MRWSWRLGRIAGIRLYMHWTFLLLLGWIALIYVASGNNLAMALHAAGFLAAVFGCVILHELGHALTARRYGIETRDITLLPIGGVARLERLPEEPRQEVWVALAGPAVNVVIAAVLAGVLWALGGLSRISTMFQDITVLGGPFLEGLFWVNVILAGFNLLPAFPMDGGRVLRALLAMRTNYLSATQVAATIGQGMAILFGIAGLLLFHPILLFIAIFVYLGAEAEARLIQMKTAIEGVPVREAMETRFRTLSPDDSLRTAVDELLAGQQQDFPVVEHGELRGMLRQDDLVSALRERGYDARVGDVTTTKCYVANEREMLARVLEKLREHQSTTVPVVSNGHVAGIVTLQNVGELLMIRSATQQADGKRSHQRASPLDVASSSS